MNANTVAGPGLPATIAEYLAQLKQALQGADPAMVVDALYDAEEYLRAELAAQPGRSEAAVIADVAGSYGAPDEVAEIYRETEVTVNRALRTPGSMLAASTPPPLGERGAPVGRVGEGEPPMPVAVPRSWLARFFGVVAEPRTYGALFYLLLSGVTGAFYFTWVVTGLSLSLSLLILIIGIPVALLFFASVRGLSLLEGRLVEALLGVRMPRRPRYADHSRGWLQRIGDMFSDGRTWLTLLYFVLMLPLGMLYFGITSLLLGLAAVAIWSPLGLLFTGYYPGIYIANEQIMPAWSTPIMGAVGILVLLATFHLCRGIGYLHGMMAKHLLVRL